MCGEHYIGGSVYDDGIGVRRCIVKKPFHLFHSFFGGTCLLCCDRSKAVSMVASIALA